MQVFWSEVQQSLQLALVRSYLKLYSTLHIDKLAAFVQVDPEVFRAHLHQYKHKAAQRTWVSGPPHSGKFVPSSDVDFYVDDGLIHIADVRVSRNFAEYFIRSIVSKLP